ncbi:hypothetical protein [Natrialba asiatica]|uniref:Uncharacterized protein n=1 Tax=Natrialba asiatica (strain ATCC 700177 / DSM 12278 / JCM 9576 / FERM P-10747 / NBRC 102637 / 172P1) TaxID=29540 RepID=M0AZG9_NATA1|nr:hypothetical protein [Natrialba asiatica]ELZ03368.1 hypothetical protein C481_05215 [Natrialba asiatica DSM 12278]
MPTDLPAALAESWRPLGTRTGQTTVLVASITAETTLYEPAETTPAASLGPSDIPLRSLFAVDLSISPSLSTVGIAPDAALSKAAPKAKAQFVETLTDEGLTVDGTRDTLEFEGPNGKAGRWYVLDVAYPIPASASDQGDRERGDGGETEIESESADNATDGTRLTHLDAEANVAVWPTETSYGVAGGILPLESITVASGTVETAPERDRETISELVRTVEFSRGEGTEEHTDD